MKILLDENIDVAFKEYFKEYNISTVHDEGWQSKQNGELLKLAVDNEFNFLLTLDKNIKYQQNLKKINIRIILINSKNSKLDTLKDFITQIKDTLNSNPVETIIEIN